MKWKIIRHKDSEKSGNDKGMWDKLKSVMKLEGKYEPRLT